MFQLPSCEALQSSEHLTPTSTSPVLATPSLPVHICTSYLYQLSVPVLHMSLVFALLLCENQLSCLRAGPLVVCGFWSDQQQVESASAGVSSCWCSIIKWSHGIFLHYGTITSAHLRLNMFESNKHNVVTVKTVAGSELGRGRTPTVCFHL